MPTSEEGKMVGKTKPNQIGSFMAGIGAQKGGYGVFVKTPEMKQAVLVRAVKRKTRVKASLKNGKPHISLRVYYETEIEEVESTNPTNISKEDLRSLEKEFSKEITKSLEALIGETQEAKSDIFGFGEHFRAKLPKYWNENVKTKEKWQGHVC